MELREDGCDSEDTRAATCAAAILNILGSRSVEVDDAARERIGRASYDDLRRWRIRAVFADRIDDVFALTPLSNSSGEEGESLTVLPPESPGRDAPT